MTHTCGPEHVHNIQFRCDQDAFGYCGIRPATLPPMSQAILPDSVGTPEAPRSERKFSQVIEREEDVCQNLRALNPGVQLNCPLIFTDLNKLPQVAFFKGVNRIQSKLRGLENPIQWAGYDDYWREIAKDLDLLQDLIPQLSCDSKFQADAKAHYIKLAQKVKESLPKKIFVTIHDHRQGDLGSVTYTLHDGSKRVFAETTKVGNRDIEKEHFTGKRLFELRDKYPKAFEAVVLPLISVAQKVGANLSDKSWQVTVAS